MIGLNGLGLTMSEMLDHYDEIGTSMAYNHYPVGWAHAMDCPYQWTKQVASHWGGTRNGMAVHWPAGIAAKGEVRDQFHHVIDIAPTILECAGLPQPDIVNGVTAEAHRGRQPALQPSTTRPRPSDTRRSTSRCSATAASTTTAGAP